MNVLILDDEYVNGELIGEHIQEKIADSTYILAATYNEAIKQAKLQTFDLLIADINLENSHSGIDVAKYLKYHQPAIKIIIYTGYQLTDKIKAQFLGITIDAFLEKPINWAALVKLIINITNYKSYKNNDETKKVITQIQMDNTRQDSELKAIRDDLKEIKIIINEHIIPKIDKQFGKIISAITGVMALFITLIVLIFRIMLL